MRQFAAALCVLWLSAQAASAGWIAGAGLAGRDTTVRVDWQYPWQLPPRLRNHCVYERFTARPFCSDHCGSDYQIYYCSEASFGCCHLGRGYCDWNGLLRCHP
jgi:hypothetical protein